MMDYQRTINKVSDITGELLEAQYLVIYNDSIAHMGANYGPPDPPPQMETTYFVRNILFNTQEQLLAWIESNNGPYLKKTFKVYKIEPVTIRTKVEITLS